MDCGLLADPSRHGMVECSNEELAGDLQCTSLPKCSLWRIAWLCVSQATADNLHPQKFLQSWQHPCCTQQVVRTHRAGQCICKESPLALSSSTAEDAQQSREPMPPEGRASAERLYTETDKNKPREKQNHCATVSTASASAKPTPRLGLLLPSYSQRLSMPWQC